MKALKSDLDMKDEARRKRIEVSVRSILDEFYIPKESEMYRNTPKRVARMYLEVFAGLDESNEPKLTLFDNPGYRDILALRRIPFYSLCSHHLLPIFGEVSIAYIPGEKIVGLSKLPRIVKYFASRPQIQEDLTKRLADYLYEKLKAGGVLVLIKAKHLCMEMRGPRAHHVQTVSSAIRGTFEQHPSTKEEALKILHA
jgi:GTP cyclohydrolase I